jgi:hypothetical protein
VHEPGAERRSERSQDVAGPAVERIGPGGLLGTEPVPDRPADVADHDDAAGRGSPGRRRNGLTGLGHEASSRGEARRGDGGGDLGVLHGPSSWHTGDMADLETLPAETIPDVDEVTETGEPTVAHIVKVGPGESAAAKVLEARINGTPLEALCGHVWVPSRDPRQLPMCQACKEVYDMFKIFNDGLRDTPSE